MVAPISQYYWDYYSQYYWGLPRWGWAVLFVVMTLLVICVIIYYLVRPAAGTDEPKKDEEMAENRLPNVAPPMTPSPVPSFPRDKSLPPPALSETSEPPTKQA